MIYTLVLKDFYRHSKMRTLELQFLDQRLRLSDEQEAIDDQTYSLTEYLRQMNQTIEQVVFNRTEGNKNHSVLNRVRRSLTERRDYRESSARLFSYRQKEEIAFKKAVDCISNQDLLSQFRIQDDTAHVDQQSVGQYLRERHVVAFLQLLVTGITKFTKARLLPTQKYPAPSFSEVHAYAAVTTERILCVLRKTTDESCITSRDESRLWEAERRLQNKLRATFFAV